MLTNEELEVALNFGLTPEAYQQMRQLYCTQKGKTWEQLTALTPQQAQIVHAKQGDVQQYLSAKITVLAEEVVMNSGN